MTHMNTEMAMKHFTSTNERKESNSITSKTLLGFPLLFDIPISQVLHIMVDTKNYKMKGHIFAILI